MTARLWNCLRLSFSLTLSLPPSLSPTLSVSFPLLPFLPSSVSVSPSLSSLFFSTWFDPSFLCVSPLSSLSSLLSISHTFSLPLSIASRRSLPLLPVCLSACLLSLTLSLSCSLSLSPCLSICLSTCLLRPLQSVLVSSFHLCFPSMPHDATPHRLSLPHKAHRSVTDPYKLINDIFTLLNGEVGCILS